MRRVLLPPDHVVASLLIMGCVLFLFRLSLFAGWTFIGDSDRLNTILNARLFEVVALEKRGSIPFWSDQQLMGYSIVSLHWMLTTFSPMPYLLALLPTSEILHALAAFSALLLGLTIGGTYWLLGAYSTHPGARIVGALLFGLGAVTLHKMSQLDLSFTAIAAMPFLLLLVRETRRETAVRVFLMSTVLWAGLIAYTILQEIAYIAMLCGTYALYRSARLRDLWPVLVAGLAVACAVTIAAPRLVTVAVEIPDLARTTVNVQTAPVEVLRYFGDGLLGRTHDENEAVRGATLNLHEGVQVLTSALGAWATIMAGLVARSGVARAWGIGLILLLSTALALWWRPFYDSLGRFEPFSRELRVVVMNAVLIGLPLWFLASVLMGKAPCADADSPRAATDDETPAAIQDTPFFLGFATLGLAAILLPEARAVLYYGFMRMDFQHARLSLVVALPLAALVTIVLSRFLPSPAGPATTRWLGAGLTLGLALWLARETAAGLLVAQLGEVMEPLRPRRLLTVEVVRVATSLVVMLAAFSLLVSRARRPLLACAGGVLAGWIVLESLSAAEFRLNGPHIRQHAVPFESLNYMLAPPGRFRVPTVEERDALRRRLETDQYRAVLQQEPQQFPALVDSHLASFWDLRLIEGYITGLPRRFTLLPLNETIYTAHHLDVNTRHSIPWSLLAALNVKYVVAVDQSLWYNPAPGGAVPPLDVERLRIQENPHPVAPRAFFAARVSPAGDPPRLPGDTGERPPPESLTIPDPRAHSVVEGLGPERTFATDGTLDASFDGDWVRVRVEPSADERFLVINERYYPGWRATVDGRPAEIYPTNIVMSGLLVSAGATSVELHYVPFIASGYGLALLATGLAMTALAWSGLRHATRRRYTDPATSTPNS
jgi:hypothetical protein